MYSIHVIREQKHVAFVFEESKNDLETARAPVNTHKEMKERRNQ